MARNTEEGWHTDPWDLHEARWFSDGRATKLVRDGNQQAYEDPPEEPYLHLPEPIDGPADPDDVKRGDANGDGWQEQTQSTLWGQSGSGWGRM